MSGQQGACPIGSAKTNELVPVEVNAMDDSPNSIYYASVLGVQPTASGNVAIWEMKWPEPIWESEQLRFKGGIGIDGQLHFLIDNEVVPLFDMANTEPMFTQALPLFVEERYASHVGLTFCRDSRSCIELAVVGVAEGTASWEYEIQLPGINEGFYSAHPCCYLPRLGSWALVLERIDRPAGRPPTRAHFLRIVARDSNALYESQIELSDSMVLAGVLVSEEEDSMALVVAESTSPDKPRPGHPRTALVHAIHFDLLDLSKAPHTYELTDTPPLDGSRLALSLDNRLLSAFHITSPGEPPLNSIWKLSAGKIVRITGQVPTPEIAGKEPTPRMRWSAPGNRLVFSNYDEQRLAFSISDSHLNRIGERTFDLTSDVANSLSKGAILYFDHLDCLICHLFSREPDQVIRCDLSKGITTVLRESRWGMKEMKRRWPEMEAMRRRYIQRKDD